MEVKTRFLRKVTKTDSCWLWNGARGRGGYGNVRINRKYLNAHKASYILFIGAVPDGLRVCHKCDVPLCVNPDHLFLGSAKDNTQDALKKNRLFRRPTPEFCPSGHKYDSQNIYKHKGRVHCRSCRKITNRQLYLQNKIVHSEVRQKR